MIWFKAWCELKPRLQMGLFMVLLTGLANVLTVHYTGAGIARSGAWDSILGASLPPVAASPDPQALIAWRAYLQVAVLMMPFLGIMMAGSGIYSRLAYALKEETHPSMIFTLALPVPRRRWLDVRAGMGLALTAGMAVIALAIPPIVTAFLHQPFSWEWPLRTAPFLLLGTTVFYMLAVMLEVLGNEKTGGQTRWRRFSRWWQTNSRSAAGFGCSRFWWDTTRASRDWHSAWCSQWYSMQAR